MMIALNRLRKRFCRHAAGASAVEFALLSPIILLLLAAVVDFGLWINARGRLEAALSGAATHVMASGQQAEIAALLELGQTAVNILALQAGDDAVIRGVIDNALHFDVANGRPGVSGDEGALGTCYCPSRQAGGIDWGAALACAAPCPDGEGVAGRYMSLAVTVPYASIFAGHGLVRTDRIQLEALVNFR